MGNDHTIVNVIDFGLAKKYRDPLTGVHIPYKQDVDGRHGVGTCLFAAINTHLGIGACRATSHTRSYMKQER
jgi:casein kinase I homolog HRR25